MGVDVDITRDTAQIDGRLDLQGARVKSTDLRASAALILLGMVADGETVVSKLNHLDRGYYNFHEKLKALGADIERV
jgi:UDP-N-acetylglucosamine 1-carboxyvinyltransferase